MFKLIAESESILQKPMSFLQGRIRIFPMHLRMSYISMFAEIGPHKLKVED